MPAADQPAPLSPAISWLGDGALRLQFGESNTPEVRQAVLRGCRALEDATIDYPFSITPAYTTILVRFDPFEFRDVEPVIRSVLAGSTDEGTPPDVKTIEIPVCYEPKFAPDLESVAAHCGLMSSQVVQLHSGAHYEVAFIGFTPGFPYLSGLPHQLATPRLPSPRVRVPIGSVGIAGEQTGIYPHATPGGWRLIGRTPLFLFDASRSDPSLLEMTDRVRFVPITEREFDSIANNPGRDR
ncbi:MAG: 5-oxoprolinase subunit PxpB [Phycisphaeraceae bacterium]|nr:5-oxoprolinase subunit PxpB [Phycisphaeraceae bacterium]